MGGSKGEWAAGGNPNRAGEEIFTIVLGGAGRRQSIEPAKSGKVTRAGCVPTNENGRRIAPTASVARSPPHSRSALRAFEQLLHLVAILGRYLVQRRGVHLGV